MHLPVTAYLIKLYDTSSSIIHAPVHQQLISFAACHPVFINVSSKMNFSSYIFPLHVPQSSSHGHVLINLSEEHTII